MYANLFFLILMILLVDIAPQLSIVRLSPEMFTEAIWWNIGGYLLTLICIVVQNRLFLKQSRLNRSRMRILASVELILFFCIAYFWLGMGDVLGQSPPYQSQFSALVPILAYLLGIAVFHFSAEYQKHSPFCEKCETAFLEVCVLLPFIVPMTVLIAFRKLMNTYPWLQQAQEYLFATAPGFILTFVSSVIFMILMMLFLPPFMQWIWRCKPVPPGKLLDRLHALCCKARFKHAGMKVWTSMGHNVTAAVVGIAPRFRYVLFTKRLLAEMQPAWVEAVLCHEIGHAYRRHLYFYPFILIGMALCGGLFSFYISGPMNDFLNGFIAENSGVGFIVYPLAIFFPYALIIGLYFRLIFGFFSRIFERQADLHMFVLHLDPRNLIHALDYMGEISGHSHDEPSWHHYSIRQRIDFLEAAMKTPAIISAHHRFVHLMLALYFALLLAASVWLMMVV